jgi:hypothetical protein
MVIPYTILVAGIKLSHYVLCYTQLMPLFIRLVKILTSRKLSEAHKVERENSKKKLDEFSNKQLI